MWDFDEIAVLELELYKNKDKHLHSIEQRLEEIEEEYIVIPHTCVNEDAGMIVVRAWNLEDAVIWKIEQEESLLGAKKRLTERCARTERALTQLKEEDKEVITLVYLEGIKTTQAYNQRRIRQALLSFYDFIMQEKAEVREEKLEAHKQAVEANLKEYLDDRKRRVKDN